jgi:hypothetical protein
MRKVFSLSLCLVLRACVCVSLFSHLHRRLIRLAISDGVRLTVCCSFPFVVVISIGRARAQEREIDLRSAMREREKKKKYYRNGQSHHLSHVCVCVDWHVKVFFLRTYTHTSTEPINSRRKCYRSERECAIKKPIETVSFRRFLFLSLLEDEQPLSKYFEYSCKRSSRFRNHNHRHQTSES